MSGAVRVQPTPEPTPRVARLPHSSEHSERASGGEAPYHNLRRFKDSRLATNHCCGSSTTDLIDRTRFQLGQQGQDLRNQRQQIFDAVAGSSKNYNSNSSARNVLLILKIPIGSKQDVISGLSRAAKKLTIRYRRPTFLLNSPYLVTLESRCEFPRERFVNEYAQARSVHRLQTPERQ